MSKNLVRVMPYDDGGWDEELDRMAVEAQRAMVQRVTPGLSWAEKRGVDDATILQSFSGDFQRQLMSLKPRQRLETIKKRAEKIDELPSLKVFRGEEEVYSVEL